MIETLTLKARKVGLLLVSLMIVSSVAVGGVAAYDSSTGSHSAELEINENTQTAFVDVVGNSSASAVNVTVTLTGLNSTDASLNGTELQSETVTVGSGATVSSTYQLADTDAADYDSIDVSVSVVDDTKSGDIDSVESGTLQEVVGGGGGLLDGGDGFLSGEIAGFPAVVVIGAVGITALVYLRD